MENLQERLNALDKSIGDIVALVVPDKISTASNLITKYTKEFYNEIKDKKEAEEITKKFNPFVNAIMSIIEVLMGNKSPNFKSTRKLILNEMYNFKDELIKGNEEINARG